MRFRFRIGPFTFGKSGTRLSIWQGGTGISIPLSNKKGRTFGKVKIGPISGYFGGRSTEKFSNKGKTGKLEQKYHRIDADEKMAIDALFSDQRLLNRLQIYGVPWRGVQEQLKKGLPKNLDNRDEIAYKLVPKAVNVIFGKQNKAWRTEKRPSKSRNGTTTWIVLIKP